MQFESHLGHVFSLFRGLWASECVQISFYGPLRGPFLLVVIVVAGALLAYLVGCFGACYLFIVVHGVGYMTGSGCRCLCLCPALQCSCVL